MDDQERKMKQMEAETEMILRKAERGDFTPRPKPIYLFAGYSIVWEGNGIYCLFKGQLNPHDNGVGYYKRVRNIHTLEGFMSVGYKPYWVDEADLMTKE